MSNTASLVDASMKLQCGQCNDSLGYFISEDKGNIPKAAKFLDASKTICLCQICFAKLNSWAKIPIRNESTKHQNLDLLNVDFAHHSLSTLCKYLQLQKDRKYLVKLYYLLDMATKAVKARVDIIDAENPQPGHH